MKRLHIECLYNTGESIEFEAASMKKALRYCRMLLDDPTRPRTLIASHIASSGVVLVNGAFVGTVGMRVPPSFISEYAHNIFKGA